jgi:ABC-type phosphate transport system substrate-binding protein
VEGRQQGAAQHEDRSAGPPPTSGTRDSFVELYLEAVAATSRGSMRMRTQDEPRFKRACDTVREDGAYVEAGENDNLIVQKLSANPSAVGIFGYSFLEEKPRQAQGRRSSTVYRRPTTRSPPANIPRRVRSSSTSRRRT